VAFQGDDIRGQAISGVSGGGRDPRN